MRRVGPLLLFYRSSEAFAAASSKLLEGLYEGLRSTFKDWGGFPIHDPSFPLVAVVEADEAAFRASRAASPQTKAIYEILTNRIHFYEPSADDDGRSDPSTGPRAVLHEGTHQILQNIGVHARLAEWPLWLSEGLAELASGDSINEQGGWSGFGEDHPLHLATLQELNARPLRYSNFDLSKSFEPGRDDSKATPTSLRLLSRESLSPTDYALVWAFVRHLETRRPEEFRAYLRELSARPPLKPYPLADQEADYVRHFGPPTWALDRRIGRELAAIRYTRRPTSRRSSSECSPTARSSDRRS